MVSRISSVLLAIFVLSGCATILKGSKEKVKFTSVPEGAKVSINGEYKGTTPFEAELQSERAYKVSFERNGETIVRDLDGRAGAGWIILDVVFGLVPLIVDAGSGNWKELRTKEVQNVQFPATPSK